MAVYAQERTTRIVREHEAAEPGPVLRKKRTIFRAYQVIWYVLDVMEALLAFRIFLKLVGANPESGFARFIYAVTLPLAGPFLGIVPSSTSGTSVIEWSTFIAMIVYLLIAYGLVQVFQFVKPVSRDEVEHEVDSH